MYLYSRLWIFPQGRDASRPHRRQLYDTSTPDNVLINIRTLFLLELFSAFFLITPCNSWRRWKAELGITQKNSFLLNHTCVPATAAGWEQAVRHTPCCALALRLTVQLKGRNSTATTLLPTTELPRSLTTHTHTYCCKICANAPPPLFGQGMPNDSLGTLGTVTRTATLPRLHSI